MSNAKHIANLRNAVDGMSRLQPDAPTPAIPFPAVTDAARQAREYYTGIGSPKIRSTAERIHTWTQRDKEGKTRTYSTVIPYFGPAEGLVLRWTPEGLRE